LMLLKVFYGFLNSHYYPPVKLWDL